jgi:hypothetical protein
MGKPSGTVTVAIPNLDLTQKSPGFSPFQVQVVDGMEEGGGDVHVPPPRSDRREKKVERGTSARRVSARRIRRSPPVGLAPARGFAPPAATATRARRQRSSVVFPTAAAVGSVEYASEPSHAASSLSVVSSLSLSAGRSFLTPN